VLYDLFKLVVTISPTGDRLRCIIPPLSLLHKEKRVSMTHNRADVIAEKERERENVFLLAQSERERENVFLLAQSERERERTFFLLAQSEKERENVFLLTQSERKRERAKPPPGDRLWCVQYHLFLPAQRKGGSL